MPEPYTPTPEEARTLFVENLPGASDDWAGALAMFDRMLDAVRAEAWNEGRRGAIADHQPPLSGFAHRENPYRKRPTVAEFTRLNVNVTEDVAASLMQLAEQRGTTVTEVVRRAIAVFDYLESEVATGRRIATSDPDGSHVRELVIL